MGILDLLRLVATDFGVALVALGVGDVALAQIERVVRSPGRRSAVQPTVARLGACLLLGLGLVAYVGVALGLAHAFSWLTLVPLLAICGIATRGGIAAWLGWARAGVPARGDLTRDPLALAAGAVLLVCVAGNYLASMAPPIARDALTYHLPQAHELAEGHVLWLNLGGHPFYGSIPKLIEVLFAEGIALDGDSLAQTLHFTLFAAFLLFAAGTVARFLGPRAGVFGALALMLYPELTSNATGSMIDAGVLSFEVAGLIAFAAWVQDNEAADAAQAAAFLGLAMASKYSAVATVLFAVAAGAFVILRSPDRRAQFPRRALLEVGGVIAALAGFWYLKNLLRTGNPAYPLYFGHDGLTDGQYRAILADVQQFGARTLGEFVRIPQRFDEARNIAPLLAFFIGPLALLNPRARRFTAVLLAYAAFYLPYWFFIATHQTRFLMPAIAVLLLLGAVVVDLAVRPSVVAIAGIAAAAAVSLVWIPSFPSELASHGRALPGVMSQAGPARYAVGLKSRDEYLTDNFGCQYQAVAWLNDHGGGGNVMDNWTQWHDPSVGYFADGYRFVSIPSAGSPAADRNLLRERDVRFYYIRASTRRRWEGTRDASERTWMHERKDIDREAGRSGPVVFRSADCEVRRVRTGSS